ncbi:MAG TPA: hypothetical protein VGQ49_07675 [Bryobacteraceae bacterium]|nr:hypothetical protein [Bryobacteraceae bacterium]
MTSFLDHAGCWFLHSGIQERDGGVARFYRSDPTANAAVSTEITGYAVSTLAYLHSRTGNPGYLDAAVRAARYLTGHAWDAAASTFPFEPGSDRAYFFDIGIIVRGLLAVWRATGEEEFRNRAQEASLSLAFDFLGEGSFHPVISLPDKQPLPPEPAQASRWSRKPGCYQLKAALAWREIGDPHARQLFDAAVVSAIAGHETFLEEEKDREKLMDRLHAYCYFLEALLYTSERQALCWGVERAARLLREIRPLFERSDVNAQLLRVRLAAHHLGMVPLDENAAREEASHIASFQALDSTDVRLRGGFWFGRKGEHLLPFSNPVSTAFCLQALALWQDHQAGRWSFELPQLI